MVVLDFPVMDDLVRYARKTRIYPHCGSMMRDVLKDFYEIARKYEADIIVRITDDCPLLTSKIIDDMVKIFIDRDVDLVYKTRCEVDMTNDGFDVEVFSFAALEKAYQWFTSQKENVTPHIRRDMNCKFVEMGPFEGCSLDTESDYRRIYEILK